MQMMAPNGPVYQAGTLSGNPLAMTAGIETLKALGKPGVYERLEDLSARLENGITGTASSLERKVTVSRIASLLTVFFTGGPVTDYESASHSDTNLFGLYFHKLLNEGIYWPPSQFEAAFISLALTEEDIDTTVRKISGILADFQ